jgi:predicted N-acyltransferase
MPYPRRKEFRRKLRSAKRVEIQEIPTGDARLRDTALLEHCYALYRNVYAQSAIQFDLLSAEFFAALLQDRSNQGVLFTYRAGGELIGFNLCFRYEGRLIDKYLGFAYPQAREHDLYFVTWFHNLDYALTHGLHCYVAGWTDPEVKRRLGAKFTFTQHAVFIRNPLLRLALQPFKRRFEADAVWHAAANHS